MTDLERAYKRPRRIVAIATFLFSRVAFGRIAEEHDIAWLLARSPDIRGSYERGEYTVKCDEIRGAALVRADHLRSTLLKTLVLVALAALGGFTLGMAALKPLSPHPAPPASRKQSRLACYFGLPFGSSTGDFAHLAGNRFRSGFMVGFSILCTCWERPCSLLFMAGRPNKSFKPNPLRGSA